MYQKASLDSVSIFLVDEDNFNDFKIFQKWNDMLSPNKRNYSITANKLLAAAPEEMVLKAEVPEILNEVHVVLDKILPPLNFQHKRIEYIIKRPYSIS